MPDVRGQAIAKGRPSRAARIRELRELDDDDAIADRIAAEGIYPKPSRRAVRRALTYESTGNPPGRPRKYATYQQLAIELVQAWTAGVRRHGGMLATKRLRECVETAETMLEHDNIKIEDEVKP